MGELWAPETPIDPGHNHTPASLHGGIVSISRCDFTFNSPGITSGGAELATVKAGTIILDAWVRVTTAWDGTTPLGDFGTPAWIADNIVGFFGDEVGRFVDMTVHTENEDGVYAEPQSMTRLALVEDVIVQANNAIDNVNGAPFGSAPHVPDTLLAMNHPLEIQNDDVLVFYVSQNGRANGADPVSTVGAASLFLVTALVA